MDSCFVWEVSIAYKAIVMDSCFVWEVSIAYKAIRNGQLFCLGG